MLPEDDPVAMLNFLRVLHHRASDITIAPDYLQKIAALCDKYCCAIEFREFFHHRYDNAFRPLKDFGFYNIDICDAFVISSMTQDQDKFRKYSDPILRLPRQEFLARVSSSLNHLIPVAVLGKSHDEWRSYIY